MKPTLFIHIPKTAGTSLIKSVTDAIGNVATEMDYGPVSKDYALMGAIAQSLFNSIFTKQRHQTNLPTTRLSKEKKNNSCAGIFSLMPI